MVSGYFSMTFSTKFSFLFFFFFSQSQKTKRIIPDCTKNVTVMLCERTQNETKNVVDFQPPSQGPLSSYPGNELGGLFKPQLNVYVSRHNLDTWVYLRLHLVTAWVHLLWLPLILVKINFARGTSTQVFYYFSTQPNLTQVERRLFVV